MIQYILVSEKLTFPLAAMHVYTHKHVVPACMELRVQQAKKKLRISYQFQIVSHHLQRWHVSRLYRSSRFYQPIKIHFSSPTSLI